VVIQQSHCGLQIVKAHRVYSLYLIVSDLSFHYHLMQLFRGRTLIQTHEIAY
jgi:hypothetical protein